MAYTSFAAGAEGTAICWIGKLWTVAGGNTRLSETAVGDDYTITLCGVSLTMSNVPATSKTIWKLRTDGSSWNSTPGVVMTKLIITTELRRHTHGRGITWLAVE